ncbi:plasmid pRiA4b ORF-3 family protein [Streptomyces sp. NBC_00847]|uniref:plasmid pRiA4b ORF-3 family protein n=1 Tax=Streptomyces sp. NBC_00847 TaxID=2975850 RepID=UPI0022550A4E|nr:plasmid pRiA4b ORF-3 family protein [Streptomyces sp. NBC_00847]MCX4882375.1 plasmid pRiA4b ORF-3 family protein [Streptomyces sp. NBC_00847]
MTAEPVPTYQLKIDLRDVSPPIWRRVTLPADTSLGCLHDIVQTCFGWDDSHLHSFTEPASGGRFVDFDAPLDRGPLRDADEESVTVAEVLPYEGGRLEYTYDFGDDWRHRITLEKILPASTPDRRVRCTGGRRAMPRAEDIGGARGLQTVLDAVTDGDAPAPEPWTVLVETLCEEGFDPARFDRDALDLELAGLDPQPPTATPAAGRAEAAPRGRRCSCGEVHDDEDLDMEFVPVRPVSLAPRAELAAAVRQVPLIASALRLAQWCQGGRAVTSRDVLKPALGRLAVQELRLWTQDDELSALRPADRDQRLARLRSSGDLPCLDGPWRLAVYADLVEISKGIAHPGSGLPATAGDEGVLELWCDALGDELDDLNDLGNLGLSSVLLGALGMEDEDGDGLAAVVLRALYEVPDGEWLDAAPLLGALREDLPKQQARLVELFFLQILDQAAVVLAEYQAAEVEPGPETSRQQDHILLGILGIGASVEDGDGTPPAGTRLRLTPLGRHGLREYLLAEGFHAPVIGELADADAPTLLDALLDYDPEAAHCEITGWIGHRGQGPAAVQLIDACAGLEADAALRRLAAAPVLAELDEPRALAVLRKAAASQVPGCAETAAIALAGRGEIPEGHGPELQLWGLVDHLWGPLGVADEALAMFLEQEGDSVLPFLDQAADDLWRCDHPATGAVLDAAGRLLRARDKALAKRLRRSATRVGPGRRP